jgi:predicted transposase YbfD/YdcC
LSQVKTNCPKLWKEVALHTSVGMPMSAHEYKDDGHGRQVHRRVELYGPLINAPRGWNGIERVVKVRRWGTRQGKPFDQTAYYVLSKPIDCAQRVASAIQSHWSIENNLHWAKDVNLREDSTTLRKHGQVSILVQLNNIAVNTLSLNGHKVVKNTFARFANKVKELSCLFNMEAKP